MRERERGQMMSTLAEQAERKGWSDFEIALAWSTQIVKMPAGDELDDPLVRQEAFLDGLAVGRLLGR